MNDAIGYMGLVMLASSAFAHATQRRGTGVRREFYRSAAQRLAVLGMGALLSSMALTFLGIS